MATREIFGAVLILILLVLPLLGACGGDSDTAEAEPVETTPVDPGKPDETEKSTDTPKKTITADSSMPAETEEPTDIPNLPPKNTYLADSVYALGHGDSAQQDSTVVAGPTGPTQELEPLQINYAMIGPAQFGIQISSPYSDGRRVIWCNGGDRIAKLDHDTFEVLDEYELPGRKIWTYQETEDAIAKFDTLRGREAYSHSIQIASASLTDLSGVYALLDRDHNLYVGNPTAITVYTDAIADDPDSEIVAKKVWPLPEEVTGLLIGMNMTYDGRLILVTEHGYVMSVSRDFSEYDVINLPHSEDAKEYTEVMFEGHGKGHGWVRNPYAIDDDGGIYIVSAYHLHKIIWTGDKLSIDEADGAWSEPLINENEIGSGSGVSLMGFGDEDKFVVITDGAKVMNLMLFWREDIPDDWEQLPGTSSRRVAGMLPVNMGDPNIEALQSDQSVVVAGYGAVMVNNEPASIPEWFPAGKGAPVVLLIGYLGADPAYTPYGVQKFEWDPSVRELKEAWVNTDISAGNGVPYVSYSTDLLYTIGVRDGKWALQGQDWTTGETIFYWIIGGERYNSFMSGVQIDQDGRIIYGSSFGKVRLENVPTRTELPTPPPMPTPTPEPTETEEPAVTDEGDAAGLTVNSTVNELIAIPEIQAILEAMWGGMYGSATTQGGDMPFREVANGFIDYGIFTQEEVDAFIAEVEAALNTETEEPAATDEGDAAGLTVDSTVNELIAIPEIQAILEAMWGGMYGSATTQGGDMPFREVANGFIDYGIFTQAEVDAFIAEVEAALN